MTSGNPILDKNLDCIGKYNPALREKLLNLPCLTNDIQLIETELSEPNLSYNGLPLHSQDGAEIEAKETFAQSKDGELVMHFILGMGLGYLFKECCEYSAGEIILYESNLDILRVTLELVDFSKELSKANVKIASNYDELEQMFAVSYKYKMEINYVLSDSYRDIYAEEADKIVERADLMHRSIFSDFLLVKNEGVERLSSIFDNLSSSLSGVPLGELKDICIGRTAIVVSAGPTLDLNLEAIKKNREKVLIFCVGTAFKTLMAYGIVPDFINILEAFDCSGQLKGFDLSEINMILEPSSNQSFYAMKAKQKFIYPANVSKWGQYWCELTNVDSTPYISCGTVSYEALQSAKILGCKTIILVGQDLAFVNNSCYSKDSAYSDLIFEMDQFTGKPEYKIKDYDNYVKSFATVDGSKSERWCVDAASTKVRMLNESSCFVKGITGEMIPSERGLAMFVKAFKDFSSQNKDLKLINTSLIGAQIDGFENISLEKALENLQSTPKLNIDPSFEFDRKQVLEKLINDRQRLQEILSEIKDALGYINKYEKELKLRKIITPTATKYFQQFLAIYQKIYDIHFQKSCMFNLMSIGENIELQHAVSTQNKSDSKKIVEGGYIALKDYYEQLQPKVLRIAEKLANSIESISESLTSV